MFNLLGTTICAVKKNGITVIGGDGQVTMNQNTVLKSNAVKVKRLFNDEVIFGFAGSVSDAFALTEKFEEMLQKYNGNLMRAAVELADQWRMDKARKLEAMMIAANKDTMLIISGTGEIVDPEIGVCAIGSGGNYALSAALALKNNTNLSAEEIVIESMKIASQLCVFTNDNLTIEKIGG
ncbi:MAG: ATP-dependent protease subunit HslV [Christensenellales bacterium]|jgi:ATP-dependent HslUV protease subunit HslV|nr:ATP-dependent protease subunit HslV [Clostridiales bacterium]